MGNSVQLKSLACCLLSGLLIVASVPPWGWWICAFLGIALFDRILSGQTALKRFIRGFSVGLVWALVGTIWMIDLTPPGWIINSIVHAGFMGLASLVVPKDQGLSLIHI